MSTGELSFSRDGGETWEPIGTISDLGVEDLGITWLCVGEPPEDLEAAVRGEDVKISGVHRDGDVIVMGGSTFCFERIGLTATPALLEGDHYKYINEGPKRDRSKPWLKPKKGRGRQL